MLRWDFRNKCENLGVYFRHQLALNGFDPLGARQLAEHMGFQLLHPRDLVDGENFTEEDAAKVEQLDSWSACVIPTHQPIIIYHPGHSPARFESSVMHELAHLILKHQSEKISFAYGKFAERAYSTRQEREAEYLGSCLQIPVTALRYARQNGMSVDEVMTMYGASREMVNWRLQACRIRLGEDS